MEMDPSLGWAQIVYIPTHKTLDRPGLWGRLVDWFKGKRTELIPGGGRFVAIMPDGRVITSGCGTIWSSSEPTKTPAEDASAGIVVTPLLMPSPESHQLALSDNCPGICAP